MKEFWALKEFWAEKEFRAEKEFCTGKELCAGNAFCAGKESWSWKSSLTIWWFSLSLLGALPVEDTGVEVRTSAAAAVKDLGKGIIFHPTGTSTSCYLWPAGEETLSARGMAAVASLGCTTGCLLARAGWPGLLPDSTQTAGSWPVTRKEKFNEHLAEPQPRGHSTLGLQGRRATVGDVCPEQVGPLDDLVEGEHFGQALDDVTAIDQVGLLYLVVPSRKSVPSKLHFASLEEEVHGFSCC